jgi:uncharacterized protein YndB with AHSA1/START domain
VASEGSAHPAAEQAATYRAEQDFSAPAEVVFNVVTDPDRMPRWLPEQLRVADTGQRCLRVAWTDPPGRDGPPADAPEYRLVVLPDRLRVEWRPSGPDGWSGYLQVHEAAAGGATAEVCVEPTGQAGESRASDRVPGILSTSMTNLGTEVADNLTAG